MINLIIFLSFIQFLLLKPPAVLSCGHTDTTASGWKAPKRICSGDTIFEDHFNHLDESVWKHEQTLSGGGNWEFQWYVNDRENSFVKDGILHIRPSFTHDHIGGEDKLYSATINIPWDQCTDSSHWGCERTGQHNRVLNPIRSAKIKTSDSFSFKYGKVEFRAKIPAGDWLWPALWLMPRDSVYGQMPLSGELDVMEARGNRNLQINGQYIGVHQISQTVHYPTHYTTKTKNNNHWSFDEEFHLYEMEWTKDKIKFSIDNELVGDLPGGKPFDQEFYLNINLAVGGTNGYFPDNAINPGGKPYRNFDPKGMTDFWKNRNKWLSTWKSNGHMHTFEVDYVKVKALD